jgi:hypothetical protein
MPLKQRLYDYNVAVLKDYGGIKQKVSIHNVLRNKGVEAPSILKYRKNEGD